MKAWRLVAVAIFLAALVVGASKTSASSRSQTIAIPCDPSVIATAFHGVDRVRSVQNFGCEGTFAYLWATIGTGIHEIGVTEVLRYDVARAKWRVVSRLKYCNHHLVTHYIFHWGCTSN